MRLFYSERFRESYKSTPLHVRKAFKKQAELLVYNFRHPSLRTKKYNEKLGIWQARVTKGWRFYFTIDDDTYYLYDIISHPK